MANSTPDSRDLTSPAAIADGDDARGSPPRVFSGIALGAGASLLVGLVA